MLHGMGIETGIDLDKLIDAGVYISEVAGAQAELARGDGHSEQAGGRVRCAALN